MDTTIETIDAAIDDAIRSNTEDISFGKEITKTLVLSAVSTAGMIGGVFVVGLAANKVQEFKQKRAVKKAEKVAEVGTTDETPANEN